MDKQTVIELKPLINDPVFKRIEAFIAYREKVLFEKYLNNANTVEEMNEVKGRIREVRSLRDLRQTVLDAEKRQ